MTRRRGDDLGGSVVPGRRAVLELLRAGRRPVRSITLATGQDRADVLDEIADRAAAARVRVRHVERSQLEQDAGVDAPQGVVARAEPLAPTGLAALLTEDAPFLLALDSVTDPQNLGAVLRSGLAAGATGVVLPRRRGALLTPAAVKAAAGAVEHLPIALVGGIAGALEQAARAAVWTVGLDADGTADITELGIADRPLMLVLGAEGHGLSRLVAKRCDARARIPMVGPIESLNVAAAAAVACFEVARQRRG